MNFVMNALSNKLLERKRGRAIKVFDDDTFITSYPKSGNTWMRFLIGNLLYDDFSFVNMESLIPDIYINKNKELFKVKRPRILKSHEYFDYKYKKIIYIVRDPRSVAVSYYFHQKKMNKIPSNMTFSEFLILFLNGKVDSYGTWSENVLSWVCVKETHKDDFLLLKYEEIKTNPLDALQQVSNFLSIPFTEEKIKRAIEKSSIKSMQKNEKENAGKIKALNNSDQNASFVRKGKTDEWKDFFTDKEIMLLNDTFGHAMKKLGYSC